MLGAPSRHHPTGGFPQPADFRRGSKSHSFPSRTGEREWLELNALLAAAVPFAVIAVPGSVRPGSTFLLGVSCLARGLIACCAAGLQGTYAGGGVSSGEDMASVAVIANSRLMSRSRARRTATSGSSDRTAGASAFLDRFSICFHSLSDSRSVASACVEAPSAAIHHDQAVFARLVSVSDFARAGASSPSTTARSVTLFLSERGE